MTLRNQFIEAGTGELLSALGGKDGGSIYDSSLSFRHLRYENSFGESNPTYVSNHPSQLIFDEAQQIYRLWNIQSLTSAAGIFVNSIWQEYCSADLVTWVFNRTYDVRGLAPILDIYSTFVDELNLFGFGNVRTYQFLCNDGRLYNAYGPELGLEPVTDGIAHSPISFYNDAGSNYVDFRSASSGYNVVTYTTSETGTTTNLTLPTGTSLYTGNGKDINTVRMYSTDDTYTYGVLVIDSNNLSYVPVIDKTGAINTSLTTVPIIHSSLETAGVGTSGLFCSHGDTNIFFPITGG